MESSRANQDKEVDRDPQKQNEKQGSTNDTAVDTSVAQEMEGVQARDRPKRGGQRQKNTKEKRASEWGKDGNKKKRVWYPPLLADFHVVKTVDVIINPLEPQVRLHPRKYIQLEPLEREETGHAGGIDSNALVDGFH